MKKASNIKLFGIPVFIFLTNLIVAQTSANVICPFTTSDITTSVTARADTATDEKPALHHDIHTRAIRGFLRNFKYVDNESWLKYEKGFIASFKKDSVETRVFYTVRGDFEVMIRYYFENRLSADIRKQVRSQFYDFRIFQVSEVSNHIDKKYFIKIQHGDYWKLIKIVNGEMEILQEYAEH